MRAEARRAVMALFECVRWGSPERGFAYKSERLQMPEDAPAQPAIYVCSGDERHNSRSNLSSVRDMEFRVFVYQNAGRDPTCESPGTENDLIMDALEARITDSLTPDDRQTLGGVVHHARIEGVVMKDSGDLDGQGVLMFSVWCMVP